jgi:MtaA/CmuA family methyltransferase
MTGRERVWTMLAGGTPDSRPLMPITMMFAADLAGIRYRDYVTDHRALVEAQLKVADTFDFDYVSAISDPAREAADLGARIEWFDDQPPAIVESEALLSDKKTLATLPIPDPQVARRMRDRVEGVRLLKEKTGGTRIVEGWVEGPCAMSADLRGLNTLMLDFTDDPEFVQELFDFCIRMELRFAEAQIAAGADLIGIGDAAASLVGPRRYEQFVFEHEKKLIAGIHAMGAKVRLHICGNTRRILGGMGRTGAEIVDLDFLSPMNEGREAMGPDQVLLGNIDPVRVLRDGPVEVISRGLEECRDAAAPHWIVGAGCEVPRGTPLAHMEVLTRFARTAA